MFKSFLKLLNTTYPEVKCGLDYKNPVELLVATILSAQCTDKRVNQVTKGLFERCKSAKDFAIIDINNLEDLIRSTWFFRSKAKNIKSTFIIICEKYWSKIPKDMSSLILLPWVWRKTANVVLWNAFWISSGIVVDTHVMRISQRIWLTENKTPEKIEADLIRIVAKKDWIMFSHRIIEHWRKVCKARGPDCDKCVFKKNCRNFEFWVSNFE